MAEQHYQEYQAYRQKLAEANITKGVLYEPRVFFDMIPLEPAPEQSEGQGDVFRNGEAFPIVLTHLTAFLGKRNQDNSADVDERLIQRVGLYLKFHDQFYMAPPQTFSTVFGGVTAPVQIATPVPAWVNKNVATSEAINRGTTNWRFSRPPLLSARDTLKVQVMTPYSVDGQKSVQVTFTGIGVLSNQPYLLSGSVTLQDSAIQTVDTDRFLNDGIEPIMITDMSVVVQPDTGELNVVQDSRDVFVSVRQIGNGTNADWFSGPLNFQIPGTGITLPAGFAGAINLGPSSGRAVVHEFPVPLLWEPGEGINVLAQANHPSGADASLQVALLGYIAVQ